MGRLLRVLALLSVMALLLAACGGDDEEATGGDAGGGGEEPAGDVGDLPDLEGETVEVIAPWTGTEAERFREVLDAFEEETGASAEYISGGDDIATALGPRIAGGNPPCVALLPQPALLQDYAQRDILQPIEDIVGDTLDENYAPTWRQLGTVDDTLYGLYYKAANKSLVWYNTQVFEDAGVEPPQTWDEFLEVTQTLSDFGVPALSIGGADGWTLTDWFENVFLRVAGPETYQALANGELAWTDPQVIEALNLLGEAWDAQVVAGGLDGALQTDFPTSVSQVFTGATPAAAMVYEGDFVAGVITGNTEAQLGEDAQVFGFPELEEGAGPNVVGGGDVATLLCDDPAGEALIQYLSTPRAGEIWAEQGGFISPNQAVDVDVYPDEISQTIARDVVEAETFVFDLSDQVPTEFGGTPGRGLFKLFQDFLAAPQNAEAIAQQMQAAAEAAAQ